MKGVQAIVKVPMVVICSGLEFLLMRRDLASTARPLDLILPVLFFKELKKKKKRWEASHSFRILNDFDTVIEKIL